ncbi:Ty3/gypsy retrotransposon protein [Cucumis melo var. makuwa]|uniref:Ty3/gypsy retrotransposon protein n=1 Tax=Cucumis melo var. makuwa TaxID=1194695 RepID=A0A5A7TXF0_CUCMM|nr:Ty3/gypsy retrotransposon protein [Cucumis melo var. makuwa]TYK08302.1 Ty3/gypsy retrotransposon protein [Cucumis melo var. makuwa]
MVQTRIEERLETMRTQSDKQEQMMLMIMETIAKDRTTTSERNEEPNAHMSVTNKGKEKEANSSKSAVSGRSNSDDRNEGKTEIEEAAADRNKFKKVEMPVFAGEDPDSWLFRAERSSRDGTVLGRFLRAKQESTVDDYRNLFDKLVAPLSDVPDPVVEDTFMNDGNSRRLPNAEFQARKEKGLCFRCNEKYSVDHRCKMKELCELKMFVVKKEGEEYEIIEENTAEEKTLELLQEEEKQKTFAELSLNSVVGLNDPGTMKIKGKIQEREVIILIDCGATHNFISEKLVESLQLPVKETGHYGVILGSGTAVQGKGICENVEIQLSNWKVKEEFLPLELGGVDVVLGMQWLHSLGITVVDWKNLTLTFSSEGKQISIKGDPSLTKSRISLKSMIKTWVEQDEGFLIECRVVQVHTENGQNSTAVATIRDEPLQNVLKQFEDIFDWPERLPPRRGIEHQIHLKEGTNPINVRPYRYGFQQKAEMERLVEEMLASGIIRPSNIPFSSPVLLVKKKDGSWRFCVDY